MVNLVGKIATFHLSPEGKDALSRLFAERFDAEVVEAEADGIWIVEPTEIDPPLQAKLLKWVYIATASVEYERPPQVQVKPARRKR